MGLYISYSIKEGFILMNSVHNRYLDILFTTITWLGDGIFIVAMAVLFFIIRKKQLAVLSISSYLLSGLVAQILKRTINSPRPKTVFMNTDYTILVDNSSLYALNSFPSGHTASAFALATVLALYLSNKNYGCLLIIYACLVGYSRVYLAQHFLIDIICGSVIGVLSGIACWFMVRKWMKIK